MRFISHLHFNNLDSSNQSKSAESSNSTKTINIETIPYNNTAHIYDDTLYQKYMYLNNIYTTDPLLSANPNRIIKILHPFEFIDSSITTELIPNSPKLKITNAFMKMYEFLLFINQHHPNLFNTSTLRLYDIAGAPGMFTIATNHFINQHHPNVKLDWFASSLEGGTALTDQYKLYSSNPTRYKPCDVLNQTDINNIVNEHKIKFDLVVGDIGIYHDNDWEHLQEEIQTNIQWGQMTMCVNMCKQGGIAFLKMYSLVSYESVDLLKTFSEYFDNVYICKPYTSRLLNDESYIIGIGRNSKNGVELIKNKRKELKIDKNDINIDLIRSFEEARLNTKYEMLMLVKYIFKDDVKCSSKLLFENELFVKYKDEMHELVELFKKMNDYVF